MTTKTATLVATPDPNTDWRPTVPVWVAMQFDKNPEARDWRTRYIDMRLDHVLGAGLVAEVTLADPRGRAAPVVAFAYRHRA